MSFTLLYLTIHPILLYIGVHQVSLKKLQSNDELEKLKEEPSYREL